MSENQKKKFRPGWLITGMVLAVLITVAYMGLYDFFRGKAMVNELEDPLEDQATADMLVRQSFVLYHDLMQRQSPEFANYVELYVKPKEGCEWVTNRELYEIYQRGEESTAQTDSSIKTLPADCGRVYNYLRYMEQEYFPDLEQAFSNQVNYNFNYYCEDLTTGVSISNSEDVTSDGKFFYLELIFDQYGNCEVQNVLHGQDATLMRKYAISAARNMYLEAEEGYKYYDESVSLSLNTYFTLGRPANCRVVYAISNENWEKYLQGEATIYINGRNYVIGVENYFRYLHSGMQEVLWALLGIMLFLGLFLPVGIKRKEEEPAARILRLPLEMLLAVGCFGIVFGIRVCFGIVVFTLNGSSARSLANHLNLMPRSNRVLALVYGGNFLALVCMVFFVWYLGVCLREVLRLGPIKYIKKRSLCYRFFPYVYSKIEKLYDSLVYFDVSKNAGKKILQLVVINGVILCLGCIIWIAGWGFVVVYSVLLYFFLRKLVNNIQVKYAQLLSAVNEIAEGRLNVQITENLGVFEPFKPQIYRIQDGFRRAVDEEVKSQRMKAELITNVSHDLKTPLTAIITYINLLKEENVTEEQRKEYLDTLERKSLRLKALIEDLFEVSKANSQNMTLNIMDVDVMNLVRQAAFEMGDKLKERGLDLRLVLPEEKVVLKLDSQRTYRVYENLFGNVAKYAMPGTRVYVNGFQVEDSVIITMKNIAENEIAVKPEELTERFVRGDASRNTEGSGLGLAIAKSFMELQGGSLEIEIDGDLFKVTTIWQNSCNFTSI